MTWTATAELLAELSDQNGVTSSFLNFPSPLYIMKRKRRTQVFPPVPRIFEPSEKKKKNIWQKQKKQNKKKNTKKFKQTKKNKLLISFQLFGLFFFFPFFFYIYIRARKCGRDIFNQICWNNLFHPLIRGARTWQIRFVSSCRGWEKKKNGLARHLLIL